MSEKATPITEEDVRKVARLSRLRLSDEEIARYTQQLGAILEYVAKLNELDVDNVEPMAHAHDVTNALREDVPQEGLTVEQALANAPQQAFDQYFRVPKVIGEGGA